MRKPIAIILFLFCFLVLSIAPASAANWIRFSSNSTGDYYFDTQSTGYVTPDDDPDARFIETWVYEEFRSAQEDGATFTQQKIWLNLEKKQYAIRAYYRYDASKYLLKGNTQRGVWRDCLPGSVGEAMYNRVRYYAEKKR